MEIHFCDLCNESVPDVDLALGRAVRRGSRVVCGACERAMSSGTGTSPWETLPREGGTLSGAPGRDPGPPSAHPGPGSAQAAARTGSPGLALALVALLFSAGAAALFARELNREREGRAEAVRDLSGSLADATRIQGRRAAALEAEGERLAAELRAGLADQGSALRAGFAELSAGLAAFEARLGSLAEGLGGLRADLARGDEDTGRRLDELAGRLAAQREDGRQLGLRLDGLAQALDEAATRAPAIPPVSPPDQAAPAWRERLADLSSPDAGLRYYAVIDLAASGDPAVVEHLAPRLADEDLFVQMAAARVLGELGAPAAIEPLIDALEDREEAVRETAVLSLRALSGRNFRFDPLASPAERARRVAAWRDWWAKARSDYL